MAPIGGIMDGEAHQPVLEEPIELPGCEELQVADEESSGLVTVILEGDSDEDADGSILDQSKADKYVEGVIAPYFYLLRDYKYYRWVWISNVISRLGDWVNYLACLEILNAYSSSGMLLSLYLITRSLPVFLMGPLAGVVADSFDRRYVMIFSDIARMVTVLAFLLVRSQSMLWLLFVVSVLQFVFGSLFEPARAALVPHVLDDYALVTANALSSTTWSAMAFIGSSAGGLVTGLFGPSGSYLIDSATYLLSALCVSRLLSLTIPLVLEHTSKVQQEEVPEEAALFEEDAPKAVETRPGKEEGVEDSLVEDNEDGVDVVDEQDSGPQLKGTAKLKASLASGLHTMWGGFRFLLANPYVLSLCMIKLTTQIPISAINEGNIYFCQHIFVYGYEGATSLGILYCVIGLGTAIFPMIGKKISKEQVDGMHNLLVISYASGCVFSVLLFWSPNFVVFLIANFFRSGTGALTWTFSTVLIQLQVPDRYMGRVFSFDFGLATMAQVVGILWAGFVLDVLEWSPHLLALSGAVFFALGFVGWAAYFSCKNPAIVIKEIDD